jgi:hypothetical protein
MTWNTLFISAAALSLLVVSPGLQSVSAARASGCEASARIDSSTAISAKRKMESAGFQQVSALRKGCDNAWHGTAVKDGNKSDVVLTPQGQVLREGD